LNSIFVLKLIIFKKKIYNWTFNNIFYFVCVTEEDIDEFNIHVSRYRPEELTKLTKITKFNKKEIQLIYRGFKQVSKLN
jgi:hypothetical protein